MKSVRIKLRSRKVVAGVVALIALGGVSAVSAAANASVSTHGKASPPKYSAPYIHQVAIIPWPAPYKPVADGDISWVDSHLHGYYWADRTNDGVDMLNTQTLQFGGVLGGFAQTGNQSPAETAACGTAILGPNGVTTLLIDGQTQLWAGDGVTTANPVSSVKVFDLSSATSGTFAASVPTGDPALGTTGTCRTDELSGDPVDHLVMAANNADNPPYVSIITANSVASQDHVVAQIKFPGATGIEQSLYDAKTKSFFVNVDNIGLVEVSPKTMKVMHVFAATGCALAGLALDPATQQLFVGCGLSTRGTLLMNALNGKIVTWFPEISGEDAVWYDPGMNLFFAPSYKMTSNGNASSYTMPEIGVVDAGGRANDPKAHWLYALSTGSAAYKIKGLGVDATNHRLFMPAISTGIFVFQKSRTYIGG